MGILITGRIWKFGDNISADYMAPGFAKTLPWEQRKKHILHIHKEFCEKNQSGDVIVAGANFGCGSAREEAPSNLKKLGIGCVVAESFARIFFRNCISIGLPIMACRGISEIFEEGDLLQLDFENAYVKNLSTGRELNGQPHTKWRYSRIFKA